MAMAVALALALALHLTLALSLALQLSLTTSVSLSVCHVVSLCWPKESEKCFRLRTSEQVLCELCKGKAEESLSRLLKEIAFIFNRVKGHSRISFAMRNSVYSVPFSLPRYNRVRFEYLYIIRILCSLHTHICTYLLLSTVIYQYVNISFLQFFSQLSRHFCVDQKPFQIDPHTKVACTTHTHTHIVHTCVCVWELAFKAAINGKNQTIRCSKISNQSSPPPLESRLPAFGFGFVFLLFSKVV